MNGIPLPPPRPTAFGTQQNIVQHSHNRPMPKKRGNMATTPIFDPLDPAGHNYNQVRENLYRNNQDDAVPAPMPPSSKSPQTAEMQQKEAGIRYLESIRNKQGVYKMKSGMLIEV